MCKCRIPAKARDKVVSYKISECGSTAARMVVIQNAHRRTTLTNTSNGRNFASTVYVGALLDVQFYSNISTNLAISPSTAIAAGTIQDVWDPKTEIFGAPMAVLLAILISIGAELGPVAGSFVTQNKGWH